jgi:hypothetical protein
LTDGTPCGIFEDIRTALEVLTRAPIRFKHIEFEKDLSEAHGAFYLKGEEFSLLYINHRHAAEVAFELVIDEGLYMVRFDTPQQVRIIRNIGSSCWMVGTSATDRHGEPLVLTKK